MVVVLVVLLLACEINCNSITIPKNEEKECDLVKCVRDIVEKYFEKEKVLTYINLNADDSGIIAALNESPTISIILRIPFKKFERLNEAYIITANDVPNFLFFEFLYNEAGWTPSARLVIIIKKLFDIEKVFKKLLRFHVFNVIVINGTNQADIYTYNPFENFACGRYFDRVISYGPCASPRISDFFPNKPETGLRNCTINMAVNYMPPFTVKPNYCHEKVQQFCGGIEQYAFEMLSELGGFRVNYTSIDFAEEFSYIDAGMMAIGSFSLVQKNETDGLFGFTMLTGIRSDAFSYIYQHMAYTDQFVYVVKKAGYVPVWKYLYLEFGNTVWIVLFFAIVMSTLLLIFILKPKDKVDVFLKMWDSLFLHGFSVNTNISARFFLIVWIWFAFSINAFYQCSLMSLTTNPSKGFQISTEKDIIEARLRPCLTQGIFDCLTLNADMTFERNENDCLQLVSAMEKVSKSYDVYTVTPNGVYEHNMALFTSDGSKIYRLKNPLMKLMYAFFFYKGFPMTSKLEIFALRLRENGLIERHTENMQYYSSLKHENDTDHEFKARMIVPWNFLLICYIVATFIFIVEVLQKDSFKNELETPAI